MYKLILIEDELQTLEQISELVDWNSNNIDLVGSFTSAEEAKNYIINNTVDFIISDICMPGMDGVELAKFCFYNYPHIKIVFITAFRNFDYALSAIQYGIVSYVTKPILYSKLMESINLLLLKVQNTPSVSVSDKHLQDDNDTSLQSLTSKVFKYIENNYYKQISLASAASALNFNTSYLSRAFKEKTNQNFSTYLHKYRVEKACDLIKNTNLKISAIASMVGFNDADYFYKIFKRYTGLTPLAYKNTHEGEIKDE
ncbi:MAG: response regulator [Clostridia bacterium]|nr:response regulator [Clostridia bacterium]